MDLGLRGKTALVLGAGGGLGRTIATTLAGEGVSVALADIDEAALECCAREVRAAGAQALPLVWNLTDLSVIDRHIAAIEAEFAAVDILVNITGGPPPAAAAGQDPAAWMANFQSMVLSVIATTDRVLPGMTANKWGRVITSTSSGIIAPILNLGFSNALRMALLGWSKTLAREVAQHGITANVVVPGRVQTSRTKFLDDSRAKRENRPVDEVVAESTSAIPAGRYGTPREYADVVTFLASHCASYVTGSMVRVDGGLLTCI